MRNLGNKEVDLSKMDGIHRKGYNNVDQDLTQRIERWKRSTMGHSNFIIVNRNELPGHQIPSQILNYVEGGREDSDFV